MSWFQALIDFLAKFWPFVIIEQWERGVPMVFGKVRRRWAWRRTPLQPGLYVLVPWFTHIEPVEITKRPVSTPLLDITLSDGKTTLSYSATAVMQVRDPVEAVTQVDDYRRSAVEYVASVTSMVLALEDHLRLAAGRRPMLISRTILPKINAETEQFGVTVRDVMFTNFVLDEPSIRLRQDSAISSTAWDD